MGSERWKFVNGSSAYAVSDLGNVWSFRRKRQLAPMKHNLNARFVYLYYGGGIKKRYYVHHLVLKAFVGEPRKGQECNHIDGDRSNNMLSNLEWLSHAENQKHAVLNNLYHQKISDNEVRSIRKMYAAGQHSVKSLARLFNISRTHVRRLINRTRRFYVTDI